MNDERALNCFLFSGLTVCAGILAALSAARFLE